jgi:hypothetical protein
MYAWRKNHAAEALVFLVISTSKLKVFFDSVGKSGQRPACCDGVE